MSGIAGNGGLLIQAGPHRAQSTCGETLNVDRPIGREMADVIVRTIKSEGLTPNDVMAIEFRGEGRPIISRIPFLRVPS